MLKTHQSIAIPDYLLSNYLKLGVTDKEFIMLLHFNAIPDSGKSAWQIVAERMGYQTEAPITKLVGSLVDKGLIELTGRGYDLDATKLYDTCLQMMDKPETIEIVVMEKPKKEKKNEEYIIAATIIEKYGCTFPKDALAQTIKSLHKQGIPLEDFVDWAHWMDSGNRYVADQKNIPIAIKHPLKGQSLIYSNYERWVKDGKSKEWAINREKSNLQVL